MDKDVKEIKIRDIRIGGRLPFALIAGPCVIESEASALRHAEKLKQICAEAGVPFVFKASYDKANRTSIDSFRGPGIDKGLTILKKICKEFDLPVTSDVHSVYEARKAGEVLDVIQIPALLSRQTDLIVAAARTGKCVNVKKGQFLSPWDVGNIIKKIRASGNEKIIITERGTTFGYNNLVSDFRSLLIMREFGYPVCYDATHSVQIPGGLGSKSGGDSRFVPYLSRAAVVCGADMIFLEVHENPAKALSDGPNMVRLGELKALLNTLKELNACVRKCER